MVGFLLERSHLVFDGFEMVLEVEQHIFQLGHDPIRHCEFGPEFF